MKQLDELREQMQELINRLSARYNLDGYDIVGLLEITKYEVLLSLQEDEGDAP